MLSLVISIMIGTMFVVSLRRPLRALVDARRQQSNLRRALAAAAEEEPVDPYTHLSPGLARLVVDTRVLRSVLEEPLQAAQAWCRADANPILSKVDFGDGSDLDCCDDFDVALVNARQAVWDWVSAVAALPEGDRERLVELGLSDREARSLLAERDAFRRTSRTPKTELSRIEAQMRPLMAALDYFEAGLARSRSAIYR